MFIFSALNDFAEPTDVAVIEETKQIQLSKTGELPDNLDFKLNLVHGSKPVLLHLHRNDIRNEIRQVAVIRKNRAGKAVVVKESLPRIKVWCLCLVLQLAKYSNIQITCIK